MTNASSFSYVIVVAIVETILLLFGLLFLYSNYWLEVSHAYNGTGIDNQPLKLQDNITGKVSLTAKINVDNLTSIKTGHSKPGTIVTDSTEHYLTRNYTKYISAKQQAELIKPHDYANITHTTKVIDIKHSKSISVSNASDNGKNSINTKNSYSSAIVNKGFDGLSQLCCIPPDIQLAVSSKFVMETVNTEAAIYTKTDGHLTKEFGLESLFNLPTRDSSDSHSITDPVLLFDYKNNHSNSNSNSNNRWFISISDVTTHSIRLAVSESDDPTGVWRIYNFPFESASNNCSDQPFVGVSNDKIVISVNTWSNNCNWLDNGNVSPTFRGVQFVVADKQDLLSGATHVSSIQSLPNTNYFSLRPALTLSPTTTLFLVTTDDFDQDRVQILAIDGPISNLHISKPVSGKIRTTDLSPDGIQPITLSKNITSSSGKDNKLLINMVKEKHPEYFIHTGDARVQSPIWYKGRLWLASDVGCIVKGDIQIKRSCIRIIEFDTNTSKVIRDFNIGVTGASLYYPALSIDKSGSNLGIIVGYSSHVSYPSLLVAASSLGIESNNISLKIAQIIKKGNANSLSTRYGDYFSAVVDPSESNSIWLAGQYQHTPLSTGWSTYIVKITSKNSNSTNMSNDMIHDWRTKLSSQAQK
jgi:hypothetical protein